MKKRKVSPVVTAATIALIGATPTLAVPLPSSIPITVPLEATPALVVEPDAGAASTANLKRLKKNALLAKHDLLSELNRVERVSKLAPTLPPILLTPGKTPAQLQSAPSDVSRLPGTSTNGETREPDFAALSNSSVKAKRPAGTDGRNFGKRNHGERNP